uniref:Iron-sulfer cluster scaffold protein ISU1 n=1 Tax=Solanum tuberosum TaxID=4113 RepID=M1D101_SOLTU
MLRHVGNRIPGLGQRPSSAAVAQGVFQRLYHERVVDHYNNPRNVGSFDKNDPTVGTGLVGAPACGDVMKLQIKVDEKTGKITDACFKTFGCGSAIASSSLATEWVKGRTMEEALSIKNTLKRLRLNCLEFKAFYNPLFVLGFDPVLKRVIYERIDAHMKDLVNLKFSTRREIAKHLFLPPQKIHCSMLAEDAIRAAKKDYEAKQAKFNENAENASTEKAV